MKKKTTVHRKWEPKTPKKNAANEKWKLYTKTISARNVKKNHHYH